jgi:predicted RNase H-like nuclease
MRTRSVAAALSVALVLAVPLAAPVGAASHDWATTLHYKWSGYHRYGSTPMLLHADGTFVIREGGGGRWRIDRSAHRLVLRFDAGCDPVYTGTLHGMQARGTMVCRRFHGRWFIDRLRPTKG